MFRKSKDGVLGGLNLQLVTLFLHTLQRLGSPECSRALSLWQIYIKKKQALWCRLDKRSHCFVGAGELHGGRRRRKKDDAKYTVEDHGKKTD